MNQNQDFYSQEDAKSQVIRYLSECKELREALALSGDELLEIETLGHGEHNENFLLRHPRTREQFIFRINRENLFGFDHPAFYEKEVLGQVAPTGRAPKVLYIDGSCTFFERDVSVLDYCPGRLSDFRNKSDLHEIAQTLADIHSVQLRGSERLRQCGDMVPDLLEQARYEFEIYTQSSCKDDHILTRAERLFQLTYEAVDGCPPLPQADATHLLHCEPIFDHFVIDDDGACMLIDWETAAVGEVARDIAGMLTPTSSICGDYLFTREGMDDFIEDYWAAVDGRFEQGAFFERLPACESVEALRGITWALKTMVEYMEGTPAMRNAYTWRMVETYLADEFLDMIETSVFNRPSR